MWGAGVSIPNSMYLQYMGICMYMLCITSKIHIHVIVVSCLGVLQQHKVPIN